LKDSHAKAKHYALKLLSYKGRSEKELEERIGKKGFEKAVASSTIDYLKNIGLIDDVAYAEILKREALGAKLLSVRGAQRYLFSRGIPKDIIARVFDSGENMDIENAGILIEKKLRTLHNCSSETIKRRLYNLLARKGYSFETIMSALKNKL
jgi:regulatory protein